MSHVFFLVRKDSAFFKKTNMSDALKVDEKNQDKNLAERVASLCYESFSKLPKKGKPQLGREWTILAAVVRFDQSNNSRENSDLKVVSIGTGSRCVGQMKLSGNGDLLNDSHAEVLARRGLLRYLYQELEQAYLKGGSDTFVFDETMNQCKLKHDTSFIIFTTHTPCGDGSIIPKEFNSTSDMEELQPCSEMPITEVEDGHPPEKRSRLDDSIADIYRTGAKCAQGGLQVNFFKTCWVLLYKNYLKIYQGFQTARCGASHCRCPSHKARERGSDSVNVMQ